MKAGILTFHNVPNFGAAIQAYALRRYLCEQGVDACVVDYRCKGNGDEFLPKNRMRLVTRSSNPVKALVKRMTYLLLEGGAYAGKWSRFCDFSQRFLNVKSFGEETDSLDFLFFGSDQIWNPSITGGFQDAYFGIGAKPETVCASYAASSKDPSELNAREREELCERAKGLASIGVRESGLRDFLLENGISAECVLDPTFLLKKEDYISSFELSPRREGGYVLIYALQKNSELDRVAQKVAKARGLDVVKIVGYPFAKSSEIKDAGPIEFLELLFGADYVVTNSFHGVALSIIFEKPFSSVLPISRKGRIVDLLGRLELLDRIADAEQPLNIDDIDYTKVNSCLEKHICSSKEYIKSVLDKK